MIREAFQDLNRVRQIAVIAARHGFADWVERSGFWRAAGETARPETEGREARRESAARRFRMLLVDLGPTFVKLGQILSTRADLLPAELIGELATLQDSVAPIPLEQIHAQIRAALGKDPSEVFKSIDPTPLAAASIAQVHRAITLDGDEVVIKVQRPGIAEQIRSDLSVLRTVAKLLEAVVEEVGLYTPSGIVDEFDRAIHEELDFNLEATHIRAFIDSHRNRPNVRVPKVYDAHSSRSVLTLEFLRGVKISQARLDEPQRAAAARIIVEECFRQLFQDGLFHADPHPGNVLVLEDSAGGVDGSPVLGLIDYGLVGRITPQMKETLVMLILAISLRDASSVARLLYRIGDPDSRAQLNAFRGDIEQILGKYVTSSLGDVSARNLLSDLFNLAVRYRIRVPKEYAILSRASVSVEGMLRTLHPEMTLSEMVLPHARALMLDWYNPEDLQSSLMRGLLRFQGLANDLPTQLSQILLDLEAGKFTVNVRAEGLDRIHASLRSVAAVIFSGLCACGLIIGAFIAFSHQPWNIRGIPLLGLLSVALVAMLVGAVTTWYLFGGLWTKIRLSRWFSRALNRS